MAATAPRVRLLVLLLAPLALACDDDGAVDADAAARDDAGVVADAPVTQPSDDAAAPLVLDFTATGCDALDQQPLRCTGRAPLVLSFVPLSTSTLGQVLWDFGDGSPKSYELAPRHGYARPGKYDVTLVGGSASGTVSRTRAGFVVVSANPVGGSCDESPQCDAALACVCGAGTACGPTFTRGLCTTSCRTTACPASSVCADLSTAGMATEAEPWRAPLCVAPCSRDEDCVGRWGRCRTLPGRASPGAPLTWIRGCFADAPAAVGDACRGADGALAPSSCVAGRCLDAGAFGVCSPDCRQTPCPDGFVCAVFPKEDRAGCLRACPSGATGGRCSSDPLLACVAPGGAGPKGFVSADLPASSTLCAPKPCASDAECAPAGRCALVAGAGNCVAR